MRVYGYVRVSSEEQAASGQSLDVQREKVALYCQLHDLDLVEIVEDAGISAKDLKRPGIERVLDGLAAGVAAGVVIVKMDRLSRSVRDWAVLTERYFCEKGGFALHAVEDSIDTTKASGRLVVNMLASISQWEREVIGERTAAVLRAKLAKGEPVGRAPRGLRIVREGVTETSRGRSVRFEPDDGDGLALAARARELRAEGLSLRAIAARLFDEGFRPLRASRFSAEAVRGILNNPRLGALCHAAA